MLRWTLRWTFLKFQMYSNMGEAILMKIAFWGKMYVALNYFEKSQFEKISALRAFYQDT